jgi:hypothetical protein
MKEEVMENNLLSNLEKDPGDREAIPFDQRLTCSIAEAASAIGLSRARMYELINGGAVETLRIGRRHLVRVPSLKSFLDSRAQESGMPASLGRTQH